MKTRNSELRRDLWMMLLLFGCTVLLFWKAACLRDAFFVQDNLFQNYPFRRYAAEAIAQGRLPLWCPYISCGFPLFAEGQAGVLYPLNLMLTFLPAHAALNYNVILHVFLGGLFCYLYLRVLGLSASSSLSGGMAFMFSGFLLSHIQSPNFTDVSIWLPALFLLVEMACTRNRFVYILLAGVVLALQLLAGHPQAAMYTSLGFFPYLAFRFLGFGRIRRRTVVALLVSACILLGIGIGLSAVQILPTYELMGLSPRSGGISYDRFTSMSFPPHHLIGLLLPDFFGDPGNSSFWGRASGFYIQLCTYTGVLPLMLALMALFLRKDRYVFFFFGLGSASLLLALGKYTVAYAVLRYVPGFNLFRAPSRFLLLFGFAVAVLGALGMDRLLKTGRGSRVGRIGLLAFFGICVLAVGFAVYVNRDVVFSSLAEIRTHFPVHRFELEQLRRMMWTDLGRFGLTSTFGLLMLLGAGSGLRIADCGLRIAGSGLRIAVLRFGAPVLILADLLSFGAKLNPTIDSRVYTEIPESVQFLRQDRSVHRVLSMVSERNSPFRWHDGWRYDQRSYLGYPETVRMYTGSVYGLSNFEPGWSPLHLDQHWAFLDILTERLLGLANVKYVITYKPMARAGFEPVFEGPVRIYENTRVLPRTFVVHRFEVIEPIRVRLRALARPEFEPDRVVILEEMPEERRAEERRGVSEVSASSAEIVEYEPEEVRIAVDMKEEGFLVLSDTYYPGWKVYVDGEEDRIYRADHLFRAVRLMPGRHDVRFAYRPRSFALGARVSMGTLAVTLMMIVWTARRRTRLFLEGEGGVDPECGRDLAYKLGIIVVVVGIILISVAMQFDLWRDAWAGCRATDVWGS